MDFDSLNENTPSVIIGKYKNIYTRVKYIFDVNFFIIVIHHLPCLNRH
ncbi:hypothetical protein SDC9_181245 [bioreactor metagenome]|uniref:Uncharacterized protein n=1 Tax=bioreactor metagenome TaxID=1076179 RepID=A0A645HCD9_9ZZZZ